MYKFFKLTHKWVGVIIAVLIVLFSLSGIVLNHRQLFSSADINRSTLPVEYQYNNWNNAAIRSTLKTGENSFLVYGNIGVWQTDSTFTKFRDFNTGFPSGIDNRKIFKLLNTPKALLAGTLYGLYEYQQPEKQWVKVPLPVHEENVVDMIQKGDSILVMTRSNLLVSTNLKHFNIIHIPPPANYDNKVGLFKTLWVIHSGEIYGVAGKLLVDLAALILILLSIGGVILFFSKRGLKRKNVDKERKARIKKTYQWNLKWHNKIGWITGIFLVVTTLTGMFLRPPLLIAIADARVSKIPHTELDTPNPWFDILRRIIYIPERKLFVFSTSEGFYYSDSNFKRETKLFETQPPASVMGVTVLENVSNDRLMVGSFEGLFDWNYNTGAVSDLIKMQPYIRPIRKGPPVGDYKISGYSNDFHHQPIAFEYVGGAINLQNGISFPTMPAEMLKKSPMSLWSLALEVHTGRIYGTLLGMFYILVVPLVGLLILLILISGIIIWFKFHRKKKGRETAKKSNT